MFGFFDPQKGFQGNGAGGAVQITTNRGHNNFPWHGKPGEIVAGRDPNQGRWFFASLNGIADGQTLYNYIAYYKIFDCPQNYP